MGCGESKSGLGLDGHSLKVWLNIEEVAASVIALPRADGGKGMTIAVAGMDKYGLLGELESSFHQRGLEIETGTWARKGSLVHATFHLAPLKKKRGSEELGIIRQLSTELCEVEPASTTTGVSQAAITHLKIDVEHTMGEELHIGLLSLIKKSGGRVVRGDYGRVRAKPTIRRSDSAVAQTLRRAGSMFSSAPLQDSAELGYQDSFWIEHHNIDSLIQDVFASPDNLQEQLFSNLKSRTLKGGSSSYHSEGDDMDKQPTTSLTRMTSYTESNENTKGSLLDALRLADRTALQKLVLELPVAVMARVRKTPYVMKPCDWGHQMEGFQKYMGAGIIIEAENDGAPVVQFSTLLIQKKNVGHVGAQQFRRTLAAFTELQYGEFVTSVDVNRERFTIERVFLNGAIPSGQSIGAVASAEQLFAPVWETGVQKQGSAELLPVHKIKQIKLSDVVNWNTYAVLSSALIERGELKDTFGEHFQDALNGELKIAKLTRDDCKSLPLIDIALRTVLGKLVARILEMWYKRTSVCLTCTSAEVTFRSGTEIIAGEERAAMDVIFQVRVEYEASLYSVDVPQRKPSTHEESAAGDVLQQWAAKMKDSTADADHGFTLGEAGATDTMHAETHERTGLLAVCHAIHALQQERARSCLAVADGLDDPLNGAEELTKQRSSTDQALVNALQLTTSRSVRAVSSGLILLRTVVDQNLSSESGWEARYKLVCTEPRAFNMLVGTLIEWLITACKTQPEFPDSSVESLMMFCYFREQLGRERAYVLAHGRAKPVDDEKGKEGMRHMLAARNLIGDLLQINTRFASVFRKLDKAERRFMAGDEHNPQDWLKGISSGIEMVQRMIEDLIGGDASTSTAYLSESASLGDFGRSEASSREIDQSDDVCI